MPARLLAAYLPEVGDGVSAVNLPDDANAGCECATRVTLQQGLTAAIRTNDGGCAVIRCCACPERTDGTNSRGGVRAHPHTASAPSVAESIVGRDDVASSRPNTTRGRGVAGTCGVARQLSRRRSSELVKRPRPRQIAQPRQRRIIRTGYGQHVPHARHCVQDDRLARPMELLPES
jgi:hypothetical protein